MASQLKQLVSRRDKRCERVFLMADGGWGVGVYMQRG